MDLYDQVKWRSHGKTHYGLIEEIHKDTRPITATVNDAILPIYYEIPLKNLEVIPSEWGNFDIKSGEWKDADEFNTFVQNEYKKAVAASDNLPVDVVPGKLFRVGVGDGFAYYVVVAVTKNMATVEWRGFDPDKWRDGYLGLRRRVSKDYIKHLITMSAVSNKFLLSRD